MVLERYRFGSSRKEDSENLFFKSVKNRGEKWLTRHFSLCKL